ncbi:MAG: DNA mismatch repair endonuclease MutL [Deltaproteobacteria bacterium]|nr:DNA mismatch repair endonuclease MutL [Deltaproteobacteria bacterium]
MSKIRILPEQLANQIAAGEVVERPASVVKELVENSIDAGASRIEVEIEGGGTRLIRVIDDGEGMNEDDILLSIERHGTSKIQKEEDLAAIETLGFRGEAIPSMASVSQFTIVSRPKGEELGTKVVLKYGKLIKVHETGCSFGSSFEVKNLFGNTPARRKFLRTVRTELSHIDEVVKNYALGSPHVTFILRINGKETIHLNNSLSLQQRLGRILNYRDTFIRVDWNSRQRHISGFLIPPERVTPGPAKLRIFVNGRAIKDRMIVHGVTEGLRGFLLKGKNPSGLIHVTLPAGEIDVNVHPAKHEVRFRNSRDIHTLLSRSVASAMAGEQEQLRAGFYGTAERKETTRIPAESNPTAHMTSTIGGKPEDLYRTAEVVSHYPGLQQPSQPFSVKPIVSPSTPTDTAGKEELSLPPENRSSNNEPRPQTHNLLVIGQFEDLYILCKNREGLLVIDQHAAHERLLYEKLRKQFLQGTVPRQNLLFPETVELSLFQAQLVEKYSKEIDSMGFSIREFGGNSYIISAIPALAGQIHPGELFNDILEKFGSEGGRTGGDYIDTILATMACRGAVKAGTELSKPEIDNLLNEMVKADLFSHCPHGRPVIKQFTSLEVKKWFHRT